MVAIALVFAFAVAHPDPAVSATAPPAIEIYRKALQRLVRLPQPSYIDDTEYWNVLAITPQQQLPDTHSERVLFDSTARRECVLFTPYSPRTPVIIGSSYFAPDVWLLHHPSAQQQNASASNFAPDLSDLKTIANVVAVGKESYQITYAGLDKMTNGGGMAYHLVLHPLSDPHRHNLRELWVRSATFDIVRAVMVGVYRPDNNSLAQETTVAEDFGPIGPYWLVIHHNWSYRDASANVSYKYDTWSVKMSFPRSIPAWYFDSAEFERHRTEVNLTSDWP